MIKVARTVKTHLWGILNAVQLKATNAIAELVNATIQKIKARACGFRNRARFRTAILFHSGGLSLQRFAVECSECQAKKPVNIEQNYC